MIRILIFEDNRQLAEGLSMLLNGVEGYEVVGCHHQLDGVEREVRQTEPDIVLMDIGFPSGNGIQAVRRIKQVSRTIKVIMLTGMADDASVFDSLKAGADGYILKKTPPLKLIEYVKEAHDGGAPMTPAIARMVLEAFSTVKTTLPEAEHLTLREKEVLKLLVDGASYKLVSAELNISIDTVRSHIRNIYDKLKVNSKSEAVAKAILNNIV